VGAVDIVREESVKDGAIGGKDDEEGKVEENNEEDEEGYGAVSARAIEPVNDVEEMGESANSVNVV
jgi:hypothetical protein